MQAGTHVKNGTNEEKPMTKYFLQSSLKEGQIFNVDSTFRWVFRQSKNKAPRSRNVFYKVIAKFGWLIKAERYYPHREPQGRGYYGYEALPVSTLRHDKVLRSRVQE